MRLSSLRGLVGRLAGVAALSVALGACTSVTAADVDGSAGAGTENAGGAGAGDACTTYCDAVMEACSGDNVAVYTSPETCRAVCSALPPGSPGDETGNSVACRLRQAELARATGEPDVHCPAAGPGGDGVCGNDCSGYCTLFRAACSARFTDTYDGLSSCEASCASDIPSLGGYDISQFSGNSLECRLWHVSAASVDADSHCGHASGLTPCAP